MGIGILKPQQDDSELTLQHKSSCTTVFTRRPLEEMGWLNVFNMLIANCLPM